MKSGITLLLLFFLPGIVLGQAASYGNFKVSEQEIIYQKVNTKDSVTVAQLEEYYKTLPFISDLQTTPEGLTFTMNDITVDYKKFQYSQVNTNILIQTGKFSGKVAVSIKGNKYRITVNAIEFTGNLGYKLVQQKEKITPYATKNSGTILVPDWCRPNLLGLLDKAFTDKLELKETEEKW